MGDARSFWSLLRLVATAIVLAVAPAAIVAALGRPGAVAVAPLALLAALPGSIRWGHRVGLSALAAFVVVAPLAAWSSGSAVTGAVLMGAVGVGAAVATARGWSAAVQTWVIAAGLLVVAPPTLDDTGAPVVDASYLGSLVVLLAVFGLWAVVLGSAVARRLPGRERAALPASVALPYGAVLAPALALGTYLALRLDPGGTGGWIVLTIMVVLRPSSVAEVGRRVASRVLGTVLGGAVVLVVVTVLPQGAFLALLGVAALAVALTLMLSGPYWWYSAWMTAAVVLIESGGSDVVQVDGARIAFTALGVAVVVVLVGVVELVARLLLPDRERRRAGTVRR